VSHTCHIDRSSFPGWDDFKCKVGIESDKDGLKIILTVVGDAQLGDFRSYQGVEAQHELPLTAGTHPGD
jgi:hypothetical protein